MASWLGRATGIALFFTTASMLGAPPPRPAPASGVQRRPPIDFSPLRPTDRIELNGRLVAPITLTREGKGLSLDESGALALTGANGHAAWSLLLGTGSGPPALDTEGRSYVATSDGQVFSVGDRGRLRWTAWLDRAPVGGLVIGPGWVAAATVGGVVHWLSQRDGRVIATFATATRPARAPVLLPDRALVLPTEEGELLKIDRKGILWRARVSAHSAIGVVAIGAEGEVYASDADGSVARVAPDGKLAWQAPVRASLDRSPVIGEDGTLYVAAGAELVALEPGSGRRRWAASTGGRIIGGPLVTEDHSIYVSVIPQAEPRQRQASRRGSPGAIVVIGETGARQREIPLPSPPAPGLALENHRLWVGLADGTIKRLEVIADGLAPRSPWPKARGGLANDGAVATLRTAPLR